MKAENCFSTKKGKEILLTRFPGLPPHDFLKTDTLKKSIQILDTTFY